MLLRPLTPDQLDALVDVQREGAVAGLADVFPQDRYPFQVDVIRERWAAELADPAIDCFAVVQDGQVAGFAATRGDELLHFGTALATWGTGLAGRVHDEVLAHLRTHGHDRAWLWCFDDNARGMRFYARRGWVATEITQRSDFPPHALLRRLERDLTGVALVRDATPDDVPALCTFGAAHVGPHYAPLIGEVAAQDQVARWWDADVLAAAVAAGRVVVAATDGEVTGVAQWGPGEAGPVVYKLYVRPDHRGAGLGLRLLDAVVARLPAGTARLGIEHFAANARAGEFYEREGFTVDHVEPSPSGDPALAVVWRSRALA